MVATIGFTLGASMQDAHGDADCCISRVDTGSSAHLYQDVSVPSEIVYIEDERHESVFHGQKPGFK